MKLTRKSLQKWNAFYHWHLCHLHKFLLYLRYWEPHFQMILNAMLYCSISDVITACRSAADQHLQDGNLSYGINLMTQLQGIQRNQLLWRFSQCPPGSVFVQTPYCVEAVWWTHMWYGDPSTDWLHETFATMRIEFQHSRYVDLAKWLAHKVVSCSFEQDKLCYLCAIAHMQVVNILKNLGIFDLGQQLRFL